MNWIDGAPTPEHDGYYWFKQHDQGGWPFTTMGYVHLEFPEGYKYNGADAIANGLPELVPRVSIPSLKVDKPLKDVWNIDAHVKAEVPK